MRPFLLGLVAAGLAGCAAGPSTLYAWGGYDDALYAHYKSPQDREAHVARLKAIVLAAEQGGRKVPPGVYAEYGYALLEEGLSDQAVVYFQKERDLWPESRLFMEKMIRNAQRQGAQRPAGTPATQGPAGAAETRSP
jgi:hypothetical protein